jgi:hypothetical protein
MGEIDDATEWDCASPTSPQGKCSNWHFKIRNQLALKGLIFVYVPAKICPVI